MGTTADKFMKERVHEAEAELSKEGQEVKQELVKESENYEKVDL